MRREFDLQAFNTAIDCYVAKPQSAERRAALLVQLCALRLSHQYDEASILGPSPSLARCLQNKAAFIQGLEAWHERLDADYKKVGVGTSETIHKLQSLEGFIACINDMPQVMLEKSPQVAEPVVQPKLPSNGLKYFLGASSAIAAFILMVYAALLIASVFSPALAVLALSQATIAVAAALVVVAIGCVLTAVVASWAAASGMTLMESASQLFTCGSAAKAQVTLGRRSVSEAFVSAKSDSLLSALPLTDKDPLLVDSVSGPAYGTSIK
jgi:hypothetical protein